MSLLRSGLPQRKSRSISDVVHGTIHLHWPVSILIDTPEFQRLRNIKQLGIVDRVYPSANHTRFSHSLGAYYFAFRLVKHLKESYPEFGINEADVTAVTVGALFHDNGHGAFSHMFDEAFAEDSENRITHEEMSKLIVKRIFGKKEIQEAFTEIFGPVDSLEWNKNISFICELIDSKKFDDDDNWLPKGRSVKKAFLYDIVSNSNDHIDVDKWDYLLRDSISAPYSISFSRSSADRLIQYARPMWCKYKGKKNAFTRICYAEKVAEDIRKIGVSRQELHDKVYQHKTAVAIERLLIKAMINAKDIMFLGDDGEMRNLSKVKENIGAFLRTDDTILTQISNNSKIESAVALIDKIQNREQPELIMNKSFSAERVEKIVEENNLNVTNSAVRPIKLVQEFLEKELTIVSGIANYFVGIRKIHRGSLDKDPLEKVLFYDHKIEKPEPFYLGQDQVYLKSSPHAGFYDILVFWAKGCNDEKHNEVIKKAKEIMKISDA